MAGATVLNTLLDEEALAAYLGVTRRTVRSWRASGLGPPYIKRGPKWLRYRSADVDTWLSQHVVSR